MIGDVANRTFVAHLAAVAAVGGLAAAHFALIVCVSFVDVVRQETSFEKDVDLRNKYCYWGARKSRLRPG